MYFLFITALYHCITQRAFIVVLLLLYGQSVTAELVDEQREILKEKRLWLPISYQQHYPQMLEAVEKAEKYDACEQLIDGALNESKSSRSHVVFMFRCRTSDRQLFTLDVNAHTLHVVSSIEEQEKRRKLEEEQERQREEQERQRMLEEARLRKEKEKSQYWKICEKVFNRKASLFNSAKIISEVPPDPDVNEVGEYTYYIEFQTLSSRKTVLNYLATASIHSLEKCNVSIRPL